MPDKDIAERYPECTRLKAVAEESQAIGRFIDWLEDEREPRTFLHVPHSTEADEDGEPVYRNSDGEIVRDWHPPGIIGSSYDAEELERRERDEGIDCRMVPDTRGQHCMPPRLRREDLLAQYFNIDMRKVDDERRQMLEDLQNG